MAKGSDDNNPIGTKIGGWIKCTDGYWRTEVAASGKTFSKENKATAAIKATVAPATATATATATAPAPKK